MEGDFSAGRVDVRKTPFPWFGGKADAAPAVWAALGDVDHYIEPFAGSLAVLLRRPHPCNRTYHSETVNDLDGLLCNFWRAVAADPDGVAAAASWPVCEADLSARHLALVAWRRDGGAERLAGSPDYFDARMAGWWAWGQSAWIGSGWCTGKGPWIVGADGRIEKRPRGGDVSRKRPHVSDDGRGVNHAGTREEGVSRQLPHVSDDGRGVHRPQLREEGVSRQLPHVSDNGRGVNHAGTREEGVAVNRKLPHVSDDGRGVNHAGTREEGVAVNRQLPHVSDDGRGVNRPQLREEGVGEPEYHPMTMPELRRWMRFLSARLRHVRVLNGRWERAVTSGVLKVITVRSGKGKAGIFLDPPYDDGVRAGGLYVHDSGAVASDVRAWCREHGADPDYRIVLAGYDTEHAELEALGWTAVEWFRAGFLKGGMGQQGVDVDDDTGVKHQQHRERLWLSPHCLRPAVETPRQGSLFGGAR